MDSVDRATLIDFALGRLNDAETAALARRAEEDSEFAQTLDSLRRELATLDDARPTPLFPFSRPASSFLEIKNRSPLTSDATQEGVSPSDVDDERVVFLNATPPNAVKVRRIGPAYPYYSDDDALVAESCALQEAFPSSRAKFTQNEQNEQNEQNKQNEQNEQNEQNKQNEENSPTLLAASTRPVRRLRFIPKFIASSRDAQPSPLIAKRARRLEETDVPTFARSLDDAPFGVDVPRPDSAPLRDAVERENLEVARPKVLDENLETLADADPPKAQINEGEEREIAEIAREKILEENVETLDDADAPKTQNNGGEEREIAEIAREEILEENVETLDDAPKRATDETTPSALSPAERRLAALLGRPPSKIELDEYYWEPIVETSQVEYEPEKRASLVAAAGRLATAPAIAVGRATLAICGADRRSALGSDAFAATKPRRRQTSKISDMMISTVSGVLIAVVVVFPLMRLAVKEVFTTIAKSAVRKIGVNVAISETAPQSDLLPFISEQLVFPRYESTKLQPRDAATLPAPGTRSETFAPVDAENDPASTPPTLDSIPPDADAPLAPLQNAQE